MIENVLLKKFLHTSPHTPQEAGAVLLEQRIGVNSSSVKTLTPHVILTNYKITLNL